MPSTRYDASLAALQASATLPGHVLDLVVLTADASLLASLREACGPQHVLWHATSADAAVDLLVSDRCGILLADVGALRTDAAPLFDRLYAQFPELILTAIGTREDEAAVTRLVRSGTIQRFLRKPASASRVNQFIKAVTCQYALLHNIPAAALTTTRPHGARRFPRGLIVGAALALTAAAAFATWRLAVGG